MQEKKKEKEEKKEGKLKLQHYKKKNKVVFLWLNSILWNLYLVY